tara:strand:- start:1144 stop:1560 length:417 start_codon:yes stop_codon:yes gene_type:complete
MIPAYFKTNLDHTRADHYEWREELEGRAYWVYAWTLDDALTKIGISINNPFVRNYQTHGRKDLLERVKLIAFNPTKYNVCARHLERTVHDTLKAKGLWVTYPRHKLPVHNGHTEFFHVNLKQAGGYIFNCLKNIREGG